MSTPLVTAIVSTFGAERFMQGCLEDLVAQTIFDQVEVIVIDSNSPENEGDIVREFQREHDNIRYLRTDIRECSTGAFNRAIPIARGKYLSNANTDDRHRSDAFELMAKALDEHPEFGIVYADSLITNEPNETFANTTARSRYAWPDYTHSTGLSCCLFGPHPMWRREAHDHVGLFSVDCPIANDQDMFLRIAWKSGAVHLRENLGLFLQRPDSNSGSDKRRETIEDVMRVMRNYRTAMSLEDIFPALRDHPKDALARSAALFEMGNLCALGPYNDYQLALQFYSQALEAADGRQIQTAFANNAACVLYCMGMKDRAREALDVAGELPEAATNRVLMARADTSAARLLPIHLAFTGLGHPVVATSRMTRGLELTVDRELVWSEEIEQVPWDVYDGPSGVTVPHTEPTYTIPRDLRQANGKQPHVMIVMYGWADSGGGTMLPRKAAKALAARGHRVSVFYAGVEPRPDVQPYGIVSEHEDGVDLFGVFNRPSTFMDLQNPLREVDDPQIRSAFARLVAELTPDVVHFFNLHNLGMSLPTVCREAAIPTVFSSNNYWPICPRLYLLDESMRRCAGAGERGAPCVSCLGDANPSEAHEARTLAARRLLNQDLDVHLAVSREARQIYIRNGALPEKVTVLQQQPESVDRIFREVGSTRAITTRLEAPLRVGFIGSLLPHKGVHILCAALQAFPKGTVRGVFHGDCSIDYARYLDQLDANDVTKIRGHYEPAQLPAILSELDVVVVPSVWEDCAPFVVAEALASRAPVIGSRMGGIPDFIDEGRSGFLFEPGNPNDLAQKILRFLEDPGLLGRMQQAISAPRGFAAYVDDLIRIYAQLEERRLQMAKG